MLKAALLFGDNMVLQRDKPVWIWGKADPGEEICILMQGKMVRTAADGGGDWKTQCGPFHVSFGEQMEIRAGNDMIRFDHVQVGDVYLAGGQSNMEFHMRYDRDFPEEKKRCTDPDLRFFDYPEVSYPGQINERDYLKHYGFWRRADPEALERFSAVGYYFAKEIRQAIGIPVGIIGCSWGGTPAAAWMSREAILSGGGALLLDEYEGIEKNLDLAEYEHWFQEDPASWRTDQLDSPITDILMYGGSQEELIRKFAQIGLDMSNVCPEDFQPVIGPKHERRPCGLYESMLCQVAPYTLRGFLWYQGETDGDTHPRLYDTLFPALIGDWRKLWGEQLPFLFVQIAPLDRWLDCTGDRYVAVRSAQQHCADTVPGTGMAVITDIGEKNDIHPKKKEPVGHRLALLALDQIYKIPTLCEAPSLCGVTVKEGKATLHFANAGDGLYLAQETADGSRVNAERCGGLEIFQDGRPLREEALFAAAEGETVTIINPQIRAGKKTLVRLAQTGWYRVNLYNSAGIPARPAEIEG